MSRHRSALILALSVCSCSGCQQEAVNTRAQDEHAIRQADAATLNAAQAKDDDGTIANEPPPAVNLVSAVSCFRSARPAPSPFS